MKRWFGIAAAAVALQLCAIQHLPAAVNPAPDDKGGKKEQKIQWYELEKGLATAKREGKHAVIDVYTDWCGWCKVMDRKTYENAEVVRYAKQHFVLMKLNAESASKFNFKGQRLTGIQLARALGATGYPTTAFLTPNGDLVTSAPGFIPPEKFLPILEYVKGEWYAKNKDFQTFMEERTARE